MRNTKIEGFRTYYDVSIDHTPKGRGVFWQENFS